MSRSNNNIYKSKLTSLIKRRVMDIIMNDIEDPRIKNCIIKHLELNRDNTIAYIYVENNIIKISPKQLEKVLMKAKGFIYQKLKKELI
ncbi:ribosome-binding factor A, partial [bacterium]|nr:ribosome-binding factor A [bacterium]